MEPEWEPARSPQGKTIWSDLLRPLAEGLKRDSRELSDRTVSFIRAVIPDLFPDPESVEENRASTEASIRGAAAMFEAGADPRGVEVPPATAAYAQAGVRRGIPFTALARSYRLGHQAFADEIHQRLSELAGDDDDLPAALRLSSQWLFGYADTAMTASEEIYDAERERWLRSAAASRVETIEAVLAGRQRDPDLISTRLQYRVDGRHVAAIAWVDDAQDGSDVLAELEVGLSSLGKALGTTSSLVHPLGLLAVAAWFGSSDGSTSHALDADELAATVPDGSHLALGEPATGLEGFRASFLQAEQARRVSSLARHPPGQITRYSEVALSSLASVDLRQAAAFVERELGPLAGGDEVSRRLAETLRAFLDEQASRGRAAHRLGVHENTVSYRVRQAEELLGRYVTDRPLDLRVALELADVVRGSEIGRATEKTSE